MELRKPFYFDSFRCIAGACPDSCCKEWDVAVDNAAYYRSLPGPLGDRLRQVLVEQDGQTYMTIVDGSCPMWREDGLCRIQAELGHDALCRTCREFPRLTHDYGDFVELGLELSCPEAARIILSSAQDPVCQSLPGGEPPEYDQDAMEVLLRTRETLRKILEDRAFSVPETLALTLLYGYQAQGELDGSEAATFDPDAALEEARSFARPGAVQDFLAFFRSLEILTDRWIPRLDAPDPGPWEPRFRRLSRYFLDRYWLQAVSDYDLVSRAKLIVISCLVIRTLGGDLTSTAQLYSKEIENSAENLDSLLDGAYTAPALTDEKLLGMLLSS